MHPRPQRTQHPSVRAAHLGLGAFHRSHQAWYTERANGAGDDAWGIAAFTGRSPEAARRLATSDGVYTLVARAASGDRLETIESVVRAELGTDRRTWREALADPAVAVLTVTVTERGYAAAAEPPARIRSGLAARRAAGAGPIAIVSCDNLSGNGSVLRAAVLAHAGEHASWIRENASFVDTVVDRITPATTAQDVSDLRETHGIDDPSAVIAEPFSEWLLSGHFPSGRPAWEVAGARVVDDLRPYEERKLWLLNAAHSLLASAGRIAGFDTVAEAFADPDLRALTEAFWAEQRMVVDLPAPEIDGWLVALRERFDNPRISYRLDQIRRDSRVKIPQRIVAAARRRREAGFGVGDAQRAALGVWVDDLLMLESSDEATAVLARHLRGVPPMDRVDTVLAHLTPNGALE